MSTIAERVARGAALLDEREPGWWQRIDLGRLDIGSTCRCVLGQLWDDAPELWFDEEPDDTNPYKRALNELRLYHGKDEDLGFDREDGEHYPPLTAAWRELIEERRGDEPR
jgi:hypothetical protein